MSQITITIKDLPSGELEVSHNYGRRGFVESSTAHAIGNGVLESIRCLMQQAARQRPQVASAPQVRLARSLVLPGSGDFHV